jgi:glutamate dehydrogenase
MADEVASLVLRDNRDQNRALSLAAARAGQMVEAHARYVRALEDPGKLLDRALESLPDEEAFSERKAVGLGLTSPELAVLLAYAKTTLKGELLASDAPDDPYFLSKLERYFPTALRERFRDEMGDHRLRRELVATGLANEVVNRAGITFAFRAGEETDAAPPEVVRAYAISREVFGARDLWARVEALDYPVPVQTQTEMFLELRGLIERGVRWLLRNRRYPLDLAAEVSLFSPVAAELAALLPDLSPAPEREALVQGAERLVAAGVPPEPARRVAASKQLFSTLDIAEVAAATGEPVEAVAAVYFSLGGRLELGRLRERVEGLPGEDRRQGLARAALLEEFHDQQAALTAEVLRSTPGERRARARLDAWVAANREPVDRALRTLADLEDDDGFSDLATLTVALREIHNLVHRGTRLAPGPTVPSAR